MQTVVGVFASQVEAECALGKLQEAHAAQQVDLLPPGTPHDRLEAVPVRPDMPPVAPIIGGSLGGALGLGLGLCLILPTLDLASPDLGMGLRILAVLILGFLGAGVGVWIGRAVDNDFGQGVPIDELYVYEDALRKGRTVLIASVADEQHASTARHIMADCRAESLDAAHRNWWVGLRSDERLEYATRQPTQAR